MGVVIDSGELPSAKGLSGHALVKVIAQWQRIASRRFPFDCSALLQIIRETEEEKLWEKSCGGFTYPDRDSFLREKILIDYDLTEEHFKKVVEALKGGRESEARDGLTKAQERANRNREIHRLKTEEGLNQREIAERVGISRPQVNEVLKKEPPEPVSETAVRTTKTDTQPRKLIRFEINQGTPPTVAALKIRQKFGDEFADALKEAL